RLAALHVLADEVGTCYAPGCLSSCGNARFCRDRAIQAASPSLWGSSAGRLLPGVADLRRAEQLSRGATPAPEERPAAALLEQAGRLFDEASGPGVTGA